MVSPGESEPETEKGASRRAVYRVFGEEFEAGLADRLLETRDRLDLLRKEYEGASKLDERADVLGRALDELDAALELARDARAKVFRLEARLAARYQTVLARLRELEQARAADVSEPGPS
jgi:hypothetical protein